MLCNCICFYNASQYLCELLSDLFKKIWLQHPSFHVIQCKCFKTFVLSTICNICFEWHEKLVMKTSIPSKSFHMFGSLLWICAPLIPYTRVWAQIGSWTVRHLFFSFILLQLHFLSFFVVFHFIAICYICYPFIFYTYILTCLQLKVSVLTCLVVLMP